ncbi:MAG: DUF58 domain-containing protein [Chloroflexi bacterium]|nr:DUF58 domain-containing protein [Chloroflexota bacterium]
MSQPAPERLLQRLDWHVVRRLDGLLQGNYRTLFYGFGLDLAEVREYQAEDDIRYIDWNVTARMDHPYVRQYHEDREITAWFLLDLSPSVDFGTVNLLKRDLLINFMTVMARLLTRHGNRVGAICFGGQGQLVIPAHSGKVQVLRMLNDVLKYPKAQRTPLTDLSALVESAGRTIQRRSLIFVISDFISAPGWEASLKALTARHEVLAVRVWDPREVELPDIGPIIVEDAETGEQLHINTSDKKFRKRFAESARKREYELNATLRRLSVDTLPLSTEDDMVRAILGFAAMRKQRRWGAK